MNGLRPKQEYGSLFADARVIETQKRNARRMTDDKLRREFRLVARFHEQPPIRVKYLDTLREELTKRGLTEPSL